MNQTKDINVAVRRVDKNDGSGEAAGYYWAPVVFEPNFGPWQGPFLTEQTAHQAASAALGVPSETLKEL